MVADIKFVIWQIQVCFCAFICIRSAHFCLKLQTTGAGVLKLIITATYTSNIKCIQTSHRDCTIRHFVSGIGINREQDCTVFCFNLITDYRPAKLTYNIIICTLLYLNSSLTLFSYFVNLQNFYITSNCLVVCGQPKHSGGRLIQRGCLVQCSTIIIKTGGVVEVLINVRP